MSSTGMPLPSAMLLLKASHLTELHVEITKAVPALLVRLSFFSTSNDIKLAPSTKKYANSR